MRGLYWLTAITLVAAAVTTVAIADYSRRHAKAVVSPDTASVTPCCESAAPTQYANSAEKCCPVEVSSAPTCSTQPACPAAPVAVNENCTPPPVPVYQPPEHQQIREATLGNLAMLKDEPFDKQVSGGFAETRPTLAATDEFSFPGKAAAPVTPPSPMAPTQPVLPYLPAPVVAPPTQPSFKSIPDFKADTPAGPEVLPGLHALPLEPKADDNPVRDCLIGTAELVSLVTPPTYLMCLPPRSAKGQGTTFNRSVANANFAPDGYLCHSDEKTATTARSKTACPSECVTARPCPTDKASCCQAASKTCCAEAKCDDVVVRTYSVAEFCVTSGNNYQEVTKLITNMIAPDSWETKDSSIVYFSQGKCLVVRHKASVQKEVEDLLGQLRIAVQKHSVPPSPIIRMERTTDLPGLFELVPTLPLEGAMCWPRVITNEPRPWGDDEFFGMVPTRPDGRLMPVPTRGDINPLVPASFLPGLQDGPASRATDKRMPDFFPLALPYSPLPNGPETCEEDKIKLDDLIKSAMETPTKPVMPTKK